MGYYDSLCKDLEMEDIYFQMVKRLGKSGERRIVMQVVENGVSRVEHLLGKEVVFRFQEVIDASLVGTEIVISGLNTKGVIEESLPRIEKI